MIPNCLAFVGSDAFPHGSVTWSRASLAFAFTELCLFGQFMAIRILGGTWGINRALGGLWGLEVEAEGEFMATRTLGGTVEKCD